MDAVNRNSRWPITSTPSIGTRFLIRTSGPARLASYKRASGIAAPVFVTLKDDKHDLSFDKPHFLSGRPITTPRSGSMIALPPERAAKRTGARGYRDSGTISNSLHVVQPASYSCMYQSWYCYSHCSENGHERYRFHVKPPIFTKQPYWQRHCLRGIFHPLRRTQVEPPMERRGASVPAQRQIRLFFFEVVCQQPNITAHTHAHPRANRGCWT